MNIKDFKPGQGEELPDDSKPLTPRSKAREVAMQALYQWQLNTSDVYSLTKQFSEDGLLRDIDMSLYNDIVRYVSTEFEALDALIAPHLDRRVEMINPIEKAILRMGIFELKEKPEIPYRVVINESVELTKRFGADEGHKYVNGILDKVAKVLRPLEFAQASASE